MACSSCGKNATARVGSTLNTAIVFGEPTNDVVRIRVSGEVPGMQVGAIKYVRGTGVQDLVDSGKFQMLAGGTRQIPAPKPGTSLYYVDGIGYTDMSAARVRSGQVGKDIVVRTL